MYRNAASVIIERTAVIELYEQWMLRHDILPPVSTMRGRPNVLAWNTTLGCLD